MGDSVLLPQIRNLRSVADYRRKQMRLKKAIRTGVDVDDEANTSANLAAAQIKQNILPIMPNQDLLEASSQDKSKQYNTAFEHLKSIMTGNDASTVLRTGFPDLEQLQELNRHWGTFRRYVGDTKMSPQYFFQFWNRFRQILQATDNTGMFIPLQKGDAEDFFGGPGGDGRPPGGASGPSQGGPGGRSTMPSEAEAPGNGGDGGDGGGGGGGGGYGDGGEGSFPGTPGSSQYGTAQYEYQRPDYTLSAYRRFDPSSSSSNSPTSTISSISSNSRTRSFASSALSSAYNEANTPEANFTPVGSVRSRLSLPREDEADDLDARVQALIDGDIDALSSAASSDDTVVTSTTPDSRLFNLYKTHMTNLNLPRRRFAFEEEESPFVSNAANDVLPAVPPTFGETPDVYDNQLFFRRNRLIPAVPGYSTGDPYEELETAMSSKSRTPPISLSSQSSNSTSRIPTSNNVVLPSASNVVAPRTLANIGVPGNEEAKEAKEISVDDWWREYYQTFPTRGTYAEMIQWLDNSRTMLRQRRDYEDNFEIPPDDIAQEIETALEKAKRKAPTFGETADVYDEQLFFRRSPKASPKAAPSSSSSSKSRTPPSSLSSQSSSSSKSSLNKTSTKSANSLQGSPKPKRRTNLTPAGTKSKVQTERTPPASNSGAKKKLRASYDESSAAMSDKSSLDVASRSRGSMQGSQASSKSSKKAMSDGATMSGSQASSKKSKKSNSSKSSRSIPVNLDTPPASGAARDMDVAPRRQRARRYSIEQIARTQPMADLYRDLTPHILIEELDRAVDTYTPEEIEQAVRDAQMQRRPDNKRKAIRLKLIDQLRKNTGQGRPRSPRTRSGRNIKFGAGISAPSEPRYDQFGCYLIHVPSLSKNRLNIKFPSLASHPKIPQRIVSDELVALITKILETGQMNAPLYAALPQQDKDFFDNLAHMCKIGGKLGIAKKENNADMQRFQIVRGEILSGNDAPQLIKELKHLTLKLVTEGKIPKRSAHDLLIEISLL